MLSDEGVAQIHLSQCLLKIVVSSWYHELICELFMTFLLVCPQNYKTCLVFSCFCGKSARLVAFMCLITIFILIPAVFVAVLIRCIRLWAVTRFWPWKTFVLIIIYAHTIDLVLEALKALSLNGSIAMSRLWGWFSS